MCAGINWRRYYLGYLMLVPMAVNVHAADVDQEKLRIYPPPEFDHPYAGELQIIYPTTEEMKKLCPANEFGQRLGCARHPSQGHCLVVVGPEDELAAIGYSDVIVVRHEIAHCNGWRGNHPRIRSLKGQETQEQYGARFERWKKFVDERNTRAAELKALAPTVVEKP